MALFQTLDTASTSISVSYPCYDVFVKICGPDGKKAVASFVYRRLISFGLRVFMDNEKLQEENLGPETEAAIRVALIHVVIFFPRYAESKRSLDELLLMTKTRASIIPVYCHVTPSELRGTVYSEALRNLEKTATFDSLTLENWRQALAFIARISGFELDAANGDWGELIERVVQCVLKRLPKPFLHVAKYPAGLNEKLQDLERTVLLQQQQHIGEAMVVGIVGVGGVGKTTLAKELFNRKRSDYDQSSFLSDVREKAARGYLHNLQSMLIKDLAGRDIQIDGTDYGIAVLARHLCSIQALIIIDDVDHVNQLDALLGAKHVLSPHSLIVITSRNTDVLLRSGIPHASIYKLTGLDTEHSRELFCSHAFCRLAPLPRFEEMVDEFLEACHGLPLSLTVFGALLFGNHDLSYWKALLNQLSNFLPRDIQRRLKISYDSLYEDEKEIFLDISCFFIGEDMDKAIRIWNGSGWHGRMVLMNLMNKSLVEVDGKNCLRMHDHLRDMGRELAENGATSFQRRLWRPIDNSGLHNVFQHQTSVRGVNMVQGSSGQLLEDPVQMANRFTNFKLTNYFVDMGHSLINFIFNCGSDDSGFQLVRAQGDCLKSISDSGFQLVRAQGDCLKNISELLMRSDLLWLSWNSFPHRSLPSWIPKQNLRVLELAGGVLETLWQSDSEAPLQLRELNIGATLLRVPNSIGLLKYLEKIEIKETKEPLPEEFFHICSLKYLRLHTTMISLPGSLGNLTNLQHIDLSGSRDLQTLPDSLGNLRNLRLINLSETNLKELPAAIGKLSNLEILKLQCPFLQKLPLSLGNLTRLTELTLFFCNNLKCLPDSVVQLKQLTILTIHFATIEYLPVGIMELNNLEILKVRSCPLGEVPFDSAEKSGGKDGHGLLDFSIHKDMRMVRLKQIDLQGTRIKEISFPEGFCTNLQHLNMSSCDELVEVGALPKTLISLDLHESPALQKITGLSGLGKLRILDISECREVEELPGFDTLISLKELRASGCKKLKKEYILQVRRSQRLRDTGYASLAAEQRNNSYEQKKTEY